MLPHITVEIHHHTVTSAVIPDFGVFSLVALRRTRSSISPYERPNRAIATDEDSHASLLRVGSIPDVPLRVAPAAARKKGLAALSGDCETWPSLDFNASKLERFLFGDPLPVPA